MRCSRFFSCMLCIIRQNTSSSTKGVNIMSQQTQPAPVEDIRPRSNATIPADKLYKTDEYLHDQSAFDMDTIWFSVIPILGFCVTLAVLKVVAG